MAFQVVEEATIRELLAAILDQIDPL